MFKKVSLILACILALAVFTTAFITEPSTPICATSHIISWGLSPNTREQTPQAPDGSETLLSENDGLFVVPTEEKKAYLTFDLGYEAGYTEKVLDILKENNIKAIFFLCGNYLKQEEIIKRIIAEGHLIGNHTNHHKDLPSLSEDAAKQDITSFNEKFTAQYPNVPIKYFRPPQGRFDARTLKLAAAQNLKTVMWSIAIKDWGRESIDAAASAKKVAGRLHPGAIILFHITNAGTPKMLEQLLPQMAEKGYIIGNPNEV